MSRHSVEVGQEWASLRGGTFDLFAVTEIIEGKYLRPPDVAIIPTEFCRVKYMTGRLEGAVHEQRAPGHMLGGSYVLYRRADGSLTDFGLREQAKKEARQPCPTCGRAGR